MDQWDVEVVELLGLVLYNTAASNHEATMTVTLALERLPELVLRIYLASRGGGGGVPLLPLDSDMKAVAPGDDVELTVSQIITSVLDQHWHGVKDNTTTVLEDRLGSFFLQHFHFLQRSP